MGLNFLNQTNNIALAKDTAGHAVRVKQLKSINLFTGTDITHRHTGGMRHRKRRTATHIGISLGQDATGQIHLRVEAFGYLQRHLARHGIEYQQPLTG